MGAGKLVFGQRAVSGDNRMLKGKNLGKFVIIWREENKDHGIQSHHFMGNKWGNSGRLFLGAPKPPQMVTAAMKLKDAYSLEGKL